MYKTKTAYSSHVTSQSPQNENYLLKTSHTSIIQSNNSLGLVLSEEKIKIIPANLKQTFPMVPGGHVCFPIWTK
jgi:hypothetical protein